MISSIKSEGERDESVIPADRSAFPAHSDKVSRKAHTRRSVIIRKRERICFINAKDPFWNDYGNCAVAAGADDPSTADDAFVGDDRPLTVYHFASMAR